MRKVGDRVGAVSDGEDGHIRIFGYGVYRGRLLRPDNSPGVFGTPGELMETFDEMQPEASAEDRERVSLSMRRNPCIELDDGRGYVYGCQCWWASEESVRRQVAAYDSVEVIDPPPNQAPLPEPEVAP